MVVEVFLFGSLNAGISPMLCCSMGTNSGYGRGPFRRGVSTPQVRPAASRAKKSDSNTNTRIRALSGGQRALGRASSEARYKYLQAGEAQPSALFLAIPTLCNKELIQ